MTKTESNLFKRLLHFLHGDPSSTEELVHSLREAADRDLIDTDTLGMIEGVILLSQMKVRDIMLPKKQMICIPHDVTITEAINIIARSGHSRFPVTGQGINEIIGILHAKDLLGFHAQSDTFDLEDIIRQTTFVPESKRLDLLLTDFRNNRNHLAIVVDEYGSTSGFITLENILELIIGDIEDEFDIDEETYIKAHAHGHFIIKAHMPIEEFNEALSAHLSDENFDTIGGIVMAQFGYLPKRGESITFQGFEFKVINADVRRIKLIECIDQRATTGSPDNHE